ncbi:excinuclease ABC subunit UvrC, partial [Nocardioides sp.]|uniref:excinuclease ABC subunit UvrC n=1 Tax=Nocardioides sp. TaxID=35761 RepID=UPI0031FECA6B
MSIPTQPGVYRFRDTRGRVIYVGKAKNLRARLSSYFQDVGNLHQRTAAMVTTAASVEWTVVKTEVEALQLEYSWIQEFDPRFNVKYRDDKSYPWLAVTVGEEFPRVMVGRGAKRKGTRYFGPYSHAWAIRETVDLLLRVFPMRSCSNGVFKRSAQIGRPCLLGYIDKCAAPCVGRVDADEHRAIAQDFADFMGGRTDQFVRRIEREMYAASDAQDYEKAARLRDDLGALNKALEKQAVVFGDGTDADVIALAEDPLEVAVQIFHVRSGRIRGQRGWVADRVEDLDTSGLISEFLLQLYAGEDGDAIPREILVPAMPEDAETFEQLLSESRGAKVSIRVP